MPQLNQKHACAMSQLNKEYSLTPGNIVPYLQVQTKPQQQKLMTTNRFYEIKSEQLFKQWMEYNSGQWRLAATDLTYKNYTIFPNKRSNNNIFSNSDTRSVCGVPQTNKNNRENWNGSRAGTAGGILFQLPPSCGCSSPRRWRGPVPVLRWLPCHLQHDWLLI